MSDDENFETAQSGTSDSYPQQASALRKNGHVILKGKPCKIVEMSTSKTGKHGHAKVHFVGIDIITGKKYEDICPSTHNMNVPNVKRVEMEVLDFNETDQTLSLMTDSGETKDDLNLTAECEQKSEAVAKLFEKAQEEDSTQVLMATVVSCMGNETVKKVELKTDTQKKL